MRRILLVLPLLALPLVAQAGPTGGAAVTSKVLDYRPDTVQAGFFLGAVNGAGGVSYTGFLDRYPSPVATWGFATYKLSSTYGGSFAVVQRSSDSAMTPLGFTTNGLADAAALSSFCGSSRCYATTIYDQVNANNATCSGVRIFVAADGRVAISPEPSAYCTVPYASVYSTAQQELFAVGQLLYEDNQPNASGGATVVTTGTVTSGSGTISSIASTGGIFAGNQYNLPLSGVRDSANCLIAAAATTGNVNYYAVGSGTATLQFSPGNISPVCTQAGDTLTFSNAVNGGVLIGQGPAAGATAAEYWAIGFNVASASGYPSAVTSVRNASEATTIAVLGQSLRQKLAVWDFDTYTGKFLYDGNQFTSGTSSASVTYSTNVGLTLFRAPSGADNIQMPVIEQMVLFNQTAAGRTAMAAWLDSQYAIGAAQDSFTDSNGFTYSCETETADATWSGGYVTPLGLGSVTLGGITWTSQTGAYSDLDGDGPSVCFATNINNGATMWRFVNRQRDSDTVLTQANRDEVAGSSTFARGQSLSEGWQFVWDKYTSQNGDWCWFHQNHYTDNGSTSAASTFLTQCKSGVMQPSYEDNANATINCGSGISLTPGTVYTGHIEAFWSPSGTADTLTWTMGVNGTNLSVQCSLGPTNLFSTAASAPTYIKDGIYRGFPWSNAGNLILREMNVCWSNTANACGGYDSSATQPALPTHP